MSVYTGSCHCGVVRLEVSLSNPIVRLLECNCSICTKKGIVHLPAQERELRVIADETKLLVYKFHSGVAQHWFCRICGIHTHGRPRNNPTRLTVNARCLDNYHDLRASAELVYFDGMNHPKDARDP